MSKCIIAMVATACLTATAHSLQAQPAPAAEPVPYQDDRRIQQEELLNAIKQKLTYYADRLQQADRTKLILQTVPFAAVLPRIHPSAPAFVAVRNAPVIAALYQRLMQKWNRYQLQVFLESVRQVAVHLIQAIEVRAASAPLMRAATPSLRAMRQLLLPNVDLSSEAVGQFRQLFPLPPNLATKWPAR